MLSNNRFNKVRGSKKWGVSKDSVMWRSFKISGLNKTEIKTFCKQASCYIELLNLTLEEEYKIAFECNI